MSNTEKQTKNYFPTKKPHRVPFFRRPIFIFGFVAVIIIIIVIILLVRPRTSENSTSDHSDSDPSNTITSTEPNVVDQITANNPSATEPERPIQYEGVDPNTLPELTGAIAYQGISDDYSIYTITTTIDQFVNGTCQLALKSQGTTVYETSVSAVSDVSTSYCEPFNIPLQNLPQGEYDIQITLSADGKTGLVEGKATI